MGCSSLRSPSLGPIGDPTMEALFEWVSKSPSPYRSEERRKVRVKFAIRNQDEGRERET